MPTYADNRTKKAQPTEVGLKIAKPGFNVNSSAGNNLVFSSSWPSLPIAYEITIPNPYSSSGGPVTIPHNLKFPPFTMAWWYGPDPSGVGNTTRRDILSVDANNIYLEPYVLNINFADAATEINIKCFQLDLSRDIDYILSPGDSYNFGYDADFGIKVARPLKNADSRDLRDFSVHSRAQSPLIQAVKTQETMDPANAGVGGGVVQYTSKYDYPVFAYGFVKTSSNVFQFAPYYSQAYPRVFTDGFITYLQYDSIGAGDIGATLVILRDPMFAAASTTVQY